MVFSPSFGWRKNPKNKGKILILRKVLTAWNQEGKMYLHPLPRDAAALLIVLLVIAAQE